MPERDRGIDRDRNNRLEQGRRDTEIKRETDVRNSMGPIEDVQRDDEEMNQSAARHERVRGRAGEDAEE